MSKHCLPKASDGRFKIGHFDSLPPNIPDNQCFYPLISN